MNFEQLITLNDPRLPDLLSFPRDAVWQGLCVAVTRPKLCREGIDEVEVEAVYTGGVRRTIRLGALRITERILVDHARQRIDQHTELPAEFAGAQRSLQLEAPQPGLLLIRFQYTSPHLNHARRLSDDELDTFRTAYLQADLDQIGLLRE